MEGSLDLKDDKYPKLLKKISDPPSTLYYKGSLDKEIFANCLSVVGSRKMTNYGERVVDRVVTQAVSAGFTIVSGFMYGIDACAHVAALEAGGRTIAVMPCGIERIHPEEQTDLYDRILNSRGLVVSEVPGVSAPKMWTYPKRNRIVAGLSKGVLVVEAALESGSLITANFAFEYGRKVFVVPNSMFSENFEGVYQLFCRGARMVVSGYEIAERFELDYEDVMPVQNSLGVLELGGGESEVFELLSRESMSLDVIYRRLGMPMNELASTITMMVVRGLISEEGGIYTVNKS